MTPQTLDLLAAAAREPDAPAVAQKVLPLILSQCGAERGSIFLMSGQQVVHRLLANKETFSEVSAYKVQSALADGMAGWALKHRQGALASDTSIDERWVSLGDNSVGSAMVVPMTSRGTVVGLISLHHPQRGFFRERHLALAAEIALLLAPVFDVALVTRSAIESMQALCLGFEQPSLVVDGLGKVITVNPPMAALDIAWEGVPIAQTVLGRELGADSIDGCCFDGLRALASLPLQARSIRIQGIAVCLQLIKP